MILTIRTDKPESEVGLFSATGEQLVYETWEAHRQLAETIHHKIKEVVNQQSITGIVFYEGPGSFTGLRIGASVANSLAYSLGVPITATNGDDWQQAGVNQVLEQGKEFVAPYYGGEVFTTKPKK